MLKFHLLDHLAEVLEKFEKLEMLDLSPFERYNVNVDRAFRSTSQRHTSEMLEVVEGMDVTKEKG